MSIFWDVGNYTKIKEMGLPVITSGTQNMGNGIYLLKAGTPLSNAGAVANTSSAKYLVAEDFYFYSNTPTQPKIVKLIEQGYVDLAKAEAASGLTFTSDAKSALATAGIILVDGALQTGGSDLPPTTGANGLFLGVDAYSRPVWAPVCIVCDASYESGTWTLTQDAATLDGYISQGISVVVVLSDDETGALNVMPMLGCKETVDGEDMSFAFYVCDGGTIAAFTAADGSDLPTYTP